MKSVLLFLTHVCALCYSCEHHVPVSQECPAWFMHLVYINEVCAIISHSRMFFMLQLWTPCPGQSEMSCMGHACSIHRWSLCYYFSLTYVPHGAAVNTMSRPVRNVLHGTTIQCSWLTRALLFFTLMHPVLQPWTPHPGQLKMLCMAQVLWFAFKKSVVLLNFSPGWICVLRCNYRCHVQVSQKSAWPKCYSLQS